MKEELNIYIVNNKPDDYYNRRIEIVETTEENAKEYYSHKLIAVEDIEVLKKYLCFVAYEEEKERSSEKRFY